MAMRSHPICWSAGSMSPCRTRSGWPTYRTCQRTKAGFTWPPSLGGNTRHHFVNG
jgi:hypothetical protein